MKISVLFAVATLVPGVFLMQSTGGASVGVVDFNRAISETPEGKEAITRLTNLGNEQRAAIEGKLKEANDMENRLRVQDRVLTEAARAQLNKDLEAARTAVQTIQEEAQNKVAQMEQELLTPIEQKTTAAVNAYANERGMRIVLDASVLRNGLVYVHDAADITSEIIRRIASNVERSGQQNAFAVPEHEGSAARLQQSLRTRNWFNVKIQSTRSQESMTAE